LTVINQGTPGTWKELSSAIVQETHRRFGYCKRIFDEDVTLEELDISICNISLLLQHQTDARRVNGREFFYVCVHNPHHRRSRRRHVSDVADQEDVAADDQDGVTDQEVWPIR